VAIMQVEPDQGDPEWTHPGVFEVAPGVFRIPLPLPTDGLRAVNIYALSSPSSHGAGGADGGLVLVDSGWAIDAAREALAKALDVLGHGLGDVRRFLVTHAHRDHYELAVAVRREFGNTVSLGLGEKATIDALSTANREPLGRHRYQLVRAGATDVLDWLRRRAAEINHDPADWQGPDDWLIDGSELDLSTRTLRVVATPGHTRGHVVFVDAAAELLFAGDHVLPHITPSIGFEAAPGPLPLGDYMDSLRLVRHMPDRRLLPAHGPVTPSVHARVDQLLDHHVRRLDQAYAAVGPDGATAFAVANRLTWTRRARSFTDLDSFNQMLAVVETAAHLDVLVVQGRLTSTIDDQDVCHYSQS
jgi:glyoxylase-like metal-dependent hydrolase (beta-lactamase superfamily II)